MKLFVQSHHCPSQVLFAFDEVTDPTVQQVRWAVAYSTRRGCERLIQRVSARIGQRQWEKSEKHFVTSLDFGLTEPAAIEFLSALPASRVHIANPHIADGPSLMPGKAYHPKLYLFDAADSTGYVVGSANLTNNALITNTEVVAAGRGQPEGAAWNDIWSELIRDTAPCTAGLLDEYRRKWVRPKKRAVEPDPKPRPLTIRPGAKPVFWDAITTGSILPMAFNHFWIEAGSMPSGGSRNQLELPRGANRFFGFTHATYGNTHITIGHPPLTLRRQRWVNRPLTWHGHNKMERINLPTVAQGGFDYQNAAVLFRRHDGGFEINVLPWGDDGAVAWRAASDALKAVFRLGERGSRICGLF
ncbi:MAG: phospholipase D family protein [Candidatus Omnitrophica bacterium]|nr:phospholipase D family protein [Candidatus Omnitrophota bacterium]